MTLLCKCDGCGKTQECNANGSKPYDWYVRTNEAGKTIHACRRECIKDNGLISPI